MILNGAGGERVNQCKYRIPIMIASRYYNLWMHLYCIGVLSSSFVFLNKFGGKRVFSHPKLPEMHPSSFHDLLWIRQQTTLRKLAFLGTLLCPKVYKTMRRFISFREYPLLFRDVRSWSSRESFRIVPNSTKSPFSRATSSHLFRSTKAIGHYGK